MSLIAPRSERFRKRGLFTAVASPSRILVTAISVACQLPELLHSGIEQPPLTYQNFHHGFFFEAAS